MRVVVCISVVLAALWLMAVHVTYKGYQQAAYEDSIIHPGSVTYGTHSIASMPTVSASHRSGLLSVRGAETPASRSAHTVTPNDLSSAHLVHTSSSATVHTVGSGMGGGVSYNPSYAHNSSARGIQYGNMPVVMPPIAQAATSYTPLAAAPARYSARPYKIPGYTGDDGDWGEDGGTWWYYDEDHWRAPTIGETRFDPSLGYVVVWDGSDWVKQTEYDPGVPVGNIPWLLMVILCTAIGIYRKKTIRLQ